MFRQVQTLLIVSIESLRRGHLELWEKQMGAAVEQLDRDGPEQGGARISERVVCGMLGISGSGFTTISVSRSR